MAQTVTLTFDRDTSRDCLEFVAFEDEVIEPLEILTAKLTSEDDVILLPEEASIEIIDDGRKFLSV